MVARVVDFPREGYKTRYIFGQQDLNVNPVFAEKYVVVKKR